MSRSLRPDHEDGFTLVELLVVLIIIGVLASIAAPRYLSQRAQAHNATAVSDLRNLIAHETALEASTGLTDDDEILAKAGWSVSDARVTVCAELTADSTDITLTAWHAQGTHVYTWQRSSPIISSSEVALPAHCAEATGGNGVIVS